MRTSNRNPPTPLTPSLQRALAILARHEPLLPNEFARLMWPDAPGWRHHTRCGRKGVTPGGGMVLAAAGYLGRLSKAGRIERQYARGINDRLCYAGYRLTPARRAALQAHPDQAETSSTDRPHPVPKTGTQL